MMKIPTILQDRLTELFKFVLLMSFGASIVLLLILAVKLIFGRKISLRAHSFMWLLFTIPLLAPLPLLKTVSAKPELYPPALLESLAQIIRRGQSLMFAMALIWLFGVFFFLSLYIVSYFRTRSMIFGDTKKDREPDSEIKLLLKKISEDVRLKLPVRIIHVDKISGPFVFGFIRPVIVLPDEILLDDDWKKLEAILTHELIHIRHSDHILRLLQCFLQSIHWFNPLVWLAFKLQRQDTEYYCDQSTIKNLVNQSRLEYIKILVDSAYPSDNYSLSDKFFSGMFSASFIKSKLSNRISKILESDRKSPALTLFAFLLVIFLGFALSPKAGENILSSPVTPQTPASETILSNQAEKDLPLPTPAPFGYR